MDNSLKAKFLRLFARIGRGVRHNAGFIFLFFILNYLTMAWSLAEEDKIEVMIGYGFTLFFFSLLLTAGLYLLHHDRLRSVLKMLLIIICAIPFFVEVFSMYNYKALIGIGIINAILETNSKEAVEFIQMYFGFKEYAGIILLIVLLYVGWKKRWLNKIKTSYHLQSRILAIVLLISICYTFRMLTVYIDFLYGDLLPVQRTFNSLSVSYENMKAYKELSSQVAVDVKLTSNDSKIKNVVFILGESMNRNHMQLYGYYLPNTPFLQELIDKEEAYVFSDIVSPHSTTVAVLTKLFTFCNYESDKSWYEYNNLIDIMNSAGYRTHWLSNQESSGIWGNVAQIYANHSTMHKFTRIRDSYEDKGYLDEELFPLLEEARRDDGKSEKNFYVLHLMGGHGLYYNRYPYIFHKFREKDIRLNIGEHEKEIVAQYDNALYYNDYIVTKIMDQFRNDEALVIYLPDHGEAVYDEQGFAGHLEENPSRHMMEIPMVIWASDKFKANYPEKWQAIARAVDRPYMTDDMIHTILDLIDVKTEDFDASRSIVNDKFDSKRKRIFNELDYDTQIKTGNIPEDKK